MIEKFSSRKSKGFGILLLIVSSLLIFCAFGIPLITDNFSLVYFLISAIITILVIGLFIWFWTNTYYLIEADDLLINSGPLNKTVHISEIKALKLDQDTVGGIIKPTLSWKCLEISYGNGHSISISPENQEKFISMLKEKNNSIEIK